MAKRATGITQPRASHSHKTKKRLAAKKEMLAAKTAKGYKRKRKIKSLKHVK